MKAFIREAAAAGGFSAIGFAAAGPVDIREQEHFRACLEAGYQADMHWLDHTAAKRFDPARPMPGARTVIVLATNYYTRPTSSSISRYATLNDYHVVLDRRLRRLFAEIQKSFPGFAGRHWTDTGPVMEKYWAEKAGVGWRGKNTLVCHERYGSWIFISTLITTAEIEPDPPSANRCGSCRKCIEACPTGALTDQGVLDARRCISYLTIEQRRPLTAGQKELLHGSIFGCDVCQSVCPHNETAVETNDRDLIRPDSPSGKSLDFFRSLTETGFRAFFAGTPVTRISYEKWREHIEAAAGSQKTVDRSQKTEDNSQ